MTAIGFVTRTIHGGFRGQLKLLTVCADIDIVPNREKSGDIRQTSASSPKASRSDPAGLYRARAEERTMSACHSQPPAWVAAGSAPILVEQLASAATVATSWSGILSTRPKCRAPAHGAGALSCL